MKLIRKNNALTSDVVAMYDAVGYGEVVDSGLQQLSKDPLPPPPPEEMPWPIRGILTAGAAVYSLFKWLT